MWGSSPPRPRPSRLRPSGWTPSGDDVAVHVADRIGAQRDSDVAISYGDGEQAVAPPSDSALERGGGENFLARDASCQKGVGVEPGG